MQIKRLIHKAYIIMLLFLLTGCQSFATPYVASAITEETYTDLAYQYIITEPEPTLVLSVESTPVLYPAEAENIPEEAEEDYETEAEPPNIPVRIVAIDPGHHARGCNIRELNGPGSDNQRARVTSGTRGIATGVPEYQLVLDVSKLLRDELINRGYEVFMIRESHDVDISNSERAMMATEAGADIFLRIHADGSENQSANGIMTISITGNNPYIPELYEQSRALSDKILEGMVCATGAGNRGVQERDDLTGSNWATMPVTVIEMGFMTNPEEDRLMQTLEYQLKLVEGMANGVDLFFDQ